MSNPKKRAPIAVFNVLKSIVDTKASTLRADVAAGKRAQDEYTILCDNIFALRQVIMNSRACDATERREAEDDLDDKELQLQGIHKRIDCGRDAERVLAHVEAFYATYNTAHRIHRNAARIRQLAALKDELYERQYRLDDKIWRCQINMDLSCRLRGLVEQAQSDANIYMTEYNELEERIQKINQEIKQLQK